MFDKKMLKPEPFKDPPYRTKDHREMAKMLRRTPRQVWLVLRIPLLTICSVAGGALAQSQIDGRQREADGRQHEAEIRGMQQAMTELTAREALHSFMPQSHRKVRIESNVRIDVGEDEVRICCGECAR